MNYKEILRSLALKENTSAEEIENEMKAAINSTGLECSVKEFIELTTALLKERTIYSTIV